LHEQISKELAPKDVGYRKMNTWFVESICCKFSQNTLKGFFLPVRSLSVKESDGTVSAQTGSSVPKWIEAKGIG